SGVGRGVNGIECGFLSQNGSGVGRGVKEKDLNDVSNKAVKDGVVPSITIAFGSTHEENVIQSSTSPIARKSGLDVSFASAGNAPGKSSYVNVTGKPSGKKLNIHTFSMDGLDAMLENGPWFIQNNPLILKKWHPDENLLKEDVSTIPVWVKLYGVPITAFSDDGLSALLLNCVLLLCLTLIQLIWSFELMWSMRGARFLDMSMRNVQRISVLVFQPVSKKSTTNTVEKKKYNSESTNEVSKSNPFEVLTSVDNDMDLGKLRFLDDDGNPLVPTGIIESDGEVEVVFDETANLRISMSGKDESDKGY
ncbi:ribonuclease H-like domain-containing protein, partial [Tanacetum coccineum]